MEWRSGVKAGARNHKVGWNDLYQPEFTPNRRGGTEISPLFFQNFLTCRAVVSPNALSRKCSLNFPGHPSVFERHLGSFGALSKCTLGPRQACDSPGLRRSPNHRFGFVSHTINALTP
jgi:hypothetical protein